MEKTLGIIQTLARVGRILSKISMICCIVGAAGCLIGVVSLIWMDTSSIEIGGVTIHGLIDSIDDMNMDTAIVSTLAGLILCIGEGILAWMAAGFFRQELAAGTPFDMEIAQKMKRLGIRMIWIPILTIVLAGLTVAIMESGFGMSVTQGFEYTNGGNVGLGITFIIVSLICRLGAEQAEARIVASHDQPEA